MKPEHLTTKIFLDGGDPSETKDMIATLGFLDGQTTNPTLISKNPEARQRLARSEKFTKKEVYSFYRDVVERISILIPHGSVSVEVYADDKTSAREMIAQGKEMYAWIPNAHIKLPITSEGLRAAEEMVKEGMRVNLTLCFSQAQAAAVYAATRGATPGQVFISPFIGRLDDVHVRGLDLIEHIARMHQAGDGHVQLLAASIRTLDHMQSSFAHGADIITVPSSILQEWAAVGMPLTPPKAESRDTTDTLAPLEWHTLDLDADWTSFDISHPLTTKGIERFAADWNALIE
ncbi:MAG: transaldolase family protein [Patescibacteria group bacterium]